MFGLSENQINEICKASVYGISVETIATTENLEVAQVQTILESEKSRIEELTEHYKTMEVI